MKYATRNTLIGMPGKEVKIRDMEYWHAISLLKKIKFYMKDRKEKKSKNRYWLGYPLDSLYKKIYEQICRLDYRYHMKNGKVRATWKNLNQKKPPMWDWAVKSNVFFIHNCVISDYVKDVKNKRYTLKMD